jgi:phosphoribulokinase
MRDMSHPHQYNDTPGTGTPWSSLKAVLSVIYNLLAGEKHEKVINVARRYVIRFAFGEKK